MTMVRLAILLHLVAATDSNERTAQLEARVADLEAQLDKCSRRGWQSTPQLRARTGEAPEITTSLDVFNLMATALTKPRLAGIARQQMHAYQAAAPFPHAVLDNIFPHQVLEQLSREIPEAVDSDHCAAARTRGMCHRKQSVQYRKSAINDEADMGPATRQVFAFFKSSLWVQFLQNLTGVKALVADPHFRGSGVHMTAPGGSLDVHADFNRYQHYAMRRRVNTFLFLNDDWPRAFGGDLELWNFNMSRCVQRIAPLRGRYVVFSSTDFSYHGHPQPLAAPAGRMRRSLALYYFSHSAPTEQCINGDCYLAHSTLWQQPKGCTRCQEAACRAYRDSG